MLETKRNEKEVEKALNECRYPEDKNMNVLNKLINGNKDSICLLAIKCFTYGMMIGKRQDRERRKKVFN